MPLTDIVTVTISSTAVNLTQAGFGTPLIVSHSAGWSERVRTYSTIDDVADDFATTTPEYLAAAAIFAQDPSPTSIKIGRAANVPTQRYKIEPQAVTLNEVYELSINAEGGAAQTASYTAVASVAWANSTSYAKGFLATNDGGKLYLCTTAGTSAAGPATGPSGTGSGIADGTCVWNYAGAGGAGVTTNDAIVYGLQNAIDALAAPTVSGVGATLVTTSLQGSAGSKTLRIVANTAGDFWRVQILDAAVLTLFQDHADPGIATDLTAIELEDPDWYALITTFNSYALVLAAAGWVETAGKLYLAGSADTTIIQDTYNAATTTDIGSKNRAAAYARTHVFYHPDPEEFADAALAGRFLPQTPGSETWRMKTLAGITTQTYTGTHKTNLNAKYVGFYYTLGGVNVVGGKAEVGANEYIDVIRFRDWWVARMGERLAVLLIGAMKVPYTDAGIALVEAEVRAQNDEGIAAGGIAPDPVPTVSVPKVANVAPADKASRTLNNVNTTWVLAGAIHTLAVRATITA